VAKPKIVEVQWVDARSVYDAMSYANARASVHLSERHTLGYIVEKSKESLLISGTYDPSDEHDQEGGCDYTVIPRGWVKAIIELAPTGESKE
jgi:hypothetical protein